MKLFEMRGDDALCVVCDLVAPVERIMKDHLTAEMFAKMADVLEKKPPMMAVVMTCARLAAPVVKAHKDDCFQIAALLIGKTVEEVSSQPLFKTVKELREVWDEELRDFFTSYASTAAEK